MVPLRRLLKKRALTPLLTHAQAFLGEGWHVEIRETEDNGPAPPGCRHEPLRLNTVLIGYLVLTPPPEAVPQEWPAASIAKLARFVADCIETQIDGEALRRSLASEVLTKYREISLLHRATLGLNGSLRPRDVAQALLEECGRGELPADVGIVFLCPPTEKVFTPVCAFGDTTVCRLAEVSRSTLFWDISKTQKGEIINDLSADRRWRDEAALTSLLLFPLVAANRCVGMLALGGVSAVRFEASHLQYVGTLATVAGIAMASLTVYLPI